LEGFHLMSVARTPDALVLDVESCNQLAGCPGCGLNRTRPRSYGRGGDRRALGRGSGADPMAQYGDRYAANTPTRSRPSSSTTHSLCAPRARLAAQAIRRAIGQLRFEGTTIAGQASDNQHCTTCTSHGSNGKISTPSLSTDARLKLIVQPAPAAAGSGLDLYEELNVHRDHVQVTEAWHQD